MASGSGMKEASKDGHVKGQKVFVMEVKKNESCLQAVQVVVVAELHQKFDKNIHKQS